MQFGGSMKNNFKNRQIIARVLDMAKLHIGEGNMASSAELCYRTACDIMQPAWNNDYADITGAVYHALRSLAYSVGLAHADYCLAEKMIVEAGVIATDCNDKTSAHLQGCGSKERNH
jgi:hypothetical protein